MLLEGMNLRTEQETMTSAVSMAPANICTYTSFNLPFYMYPLWLSAYQNSLSMTVPFWSHEILSATFWRWERGTLRTEFMRGESETRPTSMPAVSCPRLWTSQLTIDQGPPAVKVGFDLEKYIYFSTSNKSINGNFCVGRNTDDRCFWWSQWCPGVECSCTTTL